MSFRIFPRFRQVSVTSTRNYLLIGYRWLAILMLGTVLLSAAFYGIITVVFMMNTHWITPIVLSKSDPKVVTLASEIFTAKQNRDTMMGEIDNSDQARTLLQTQRDWLNGIITRYQNSLNAEKNADEKFNAKLQQLAQEKRAVDAKIADAVAANRTIEKGVNQELNAGLITENTALVTKTHLLSLEAELNTRHLGTANLDNQISSLARTATSLGGGDTSTQALQNLTQISTLKQQLSDTDIKLMRLNSDVSAKSRELVELNAMLDSLKGSPYYMVASGEKDLRHFAFVPYENQNSAYVGAPVYLCKWQIIRCSKVGAVKALTQDEERVQHPLFYTQTLRGVLVELDLTNINAEKSSTLFVDHSPFYIF